MEQVIKTIEFINLKYGCNTVENYGASLISITENKMGLYTEKVKINIKDPVLIRKVLNILLLNEVFDSGYHNGYVNGEHIIKYYYKKVI